MSLNRPQLLGGDLRVVWSNGSDRGPQDPQPVEGHHHGRTIRVPLRPRPKPSAAPKKGGPTPRRAPARRAAGAARMQDPDSDMAYEPDHEPPDEVDERALRPPQAEMDSDAGGDGLRGGSQGFGQRGHHGGQPDGDTAPPLRYRAARPQEPGQDVPRRLLELGLPGAAQLFGHAGNAMSSAYELMDSFAGVMLRALGRAGAAEPSLARLALTCAQAVLRRQGAGAPLTTLSDVKQVLVAQGMRVGTPPAPLPEAIGNQYALLPVMLLNGSCPRTQRQHRAAIDRQQMILRTRDL